MFTVDDLPLHRIGVLELVDITIGQRRCIRICAGESSAFSASASRVSRSSYPRMPGAALRILQFSLHVLGECDARTAARESGSGSSGRSSVDGWFPPSRQPQRVLHEDGIVALLPEVSKVQIVDNLGHQVVETSRPACRCRCRRPHPVTSARADRTDAWLRSLPRRNRPLHPAGSVAAWRARRVIRRYFTTWLSPTTDSSSNALSAWTIRSRTLARTARGAAGRDGQHLVERRGPSATYCVPRPANVKVFYARACLQHGRRVRGGQRIQQSRRDHSTALCARSIGSHTRSSSAQPLSMRTDKSACPPGAQMRRFLVPRRDSGRRTSSGTALAFRVVATVHAAAHAWDVLIGNGIGSTSRVVDRHESRSEVGRVVFGTSDAFFAKEMSRFFARPMHTACQSVGSRANKASNGIGREHVLAVELRCVTGTMLIGQTPATPFGRPPSRPTSMSTSCALGSATR